MCKFYQGPDDGMLEDKLKMVFSSVYRDKPSASRLVCLFCFRYHFSRFGLSPEGLMLKNNVYRNQGKTISSR